MAPATAAAVAWGALAFGAVYPWAYVPLVAVCAAVGVAGFCGRRTRLAIWPLVALAAVAAAVLVQEIPLPIAALARVSPAAHQLLQQYDIAFAASADGGAAAAGGARHALSLDPARTWIGLALLAGFGVFLFGLASVLDEPMIVRLVRVVVAVGMVASLAALVQYASGTTEIYGFWKPLERGARPFGPFVNRNHFAGWILMAWALGAGYFIGRLSESIAGVRHRHRPVFAWFSTPLAGELVLVGSSLAVLAVTGLVSLSRSGITCLAAGMVILAVLAVRRTDTGWRRALICACFATIAAVAVGRGGVDRLAARLDEFQQDGLGDRARVWADGWRVARAYPIAGTGLNSFGTAMLFYQAERTDLHFNEAHNDYLQLAAEGGALIVFPALLLVGVTAVEIRRRFVQERETVTLRWTRIGAVTGLLLIAVQETGEFSLQMPGNAVLFAVLAAIALHRRAEGAQPPRRRVPRSASPAASEPSRPHVRHAVPSSIPA